MVDGRDRVIKDYAMLAPQVIHPEIVRPEVEVANFELKPVMLKILQTVGQFNGLPSEDPHLYLKLFVEVNDAFKIIGASHDALRLRLFPYFLRDRVRVWLNSLLPDSIKIYNDLADKFLMKYFPLTKNAKLWNEIISFHQLEDESLYEAWERFKEFLRRCPHHGIRCCQVLHTNQECKVAPATVNQVAEVFYVYCGEGHLFDNYPGYPTSVNYVGNFNMQNQNNPYSNTYNPG